MIIKRIIIFFMLIVAVLVIGTVGYMSIENLGFLSALYMTVITLSTVGFKEVAQLSSGGMWFTMALIGGGITVVTVTFAMFSSLILEGEMGEYLERRKMDKKIRSLKDHIIVCGLGELGEEVVRNLMHTDEKFMVIETSEDKAFKLIKETGEFPFLADDAQDINVLKTAGIEKASTLISCLGDDSKNLFVVITASEANPALTIVSEAIDQPAREKLKKVGADYVISPFQIGGKRMATVATRPTIVSFLDVVTSGGQKEIFCESVNVSEASLLAGKSLKEAEIPKRTGLIIISIKKKDGQRFIYNPSSETRIEGGDDIIVMGLMENIKKLKKYTGK